MRDDDVELSLRQPAQRAIGASLGKGARDRRLHVPEDRVSRRFPDIRRTREQPRCHLFQYGAAAGVGQIQSNSNARSTTRASYSDNRSNSARAR